MCSPAIDGRYITIQKLNDELPDFAINEVFVYEVVTSGELIEGPFKSRNSKLHAAITGFRADSQLISMWVGLENPAGSGCAANECEGVVVWDDDTQFIYGSYIEEKSPLSVAVGLEPSCVYLSSLTTAESTSCSSDMPFLCQFDCSNLQSELKPYGVLFEVQFSFVLTCYKQL